jgi:hypothetical protein
LHLLVSGSELVARVRITETTGFVSLPEGSRRPVVRAEVLEVWKGDAPEGQLLFAQHGHGVVEYEAGEEVVVFLRRVEASRELDGLAAASVAFVSFQEHDARYAMPPSDPALLARAVRGYVSAEAGMGPQERIAALRAVTLELVVSNDVRLASGAIHDLALAGDVALVSSKDVPVLLERVVEASETPVGVRVGLFVELERRGLVDGPKGWLRLLGTAKPADLPDVARAAGRHPSPQVTARLIELLGSEDREAAEAAAIALGAPAHAEAVAPLARSLLKGEPRLRMASIRGLGVIGTPDARRALEQAAGSHADPATRRRAAAEAKRLTR